MTALRKPPADTTPCVLGLDLSLRSTGLVSLSANRVRYRQIQTKTLNDLPKKATSAMWNGIFHGTTEHRINYLTWQIVTAWSYTQPALVVVEEYAFSRHSRALTPLHELGGVVKHYLSLGSALVVPYESTANKKYATGSGNASKEEMIARAQQLWRGCPDQDDVADAFLLARWGLRTLLR